MEGLGTHKLVDRQQMQWAISALFFIEHVSSFHNFICCQSLKTTPLKFLFLYAWQHILIYWYWKHVPFNCPTCIMT